MSPNRPAVLESTRVLLTLVERCREIKAGTGFESGDAYILCQDEVPTAPPSLIKDPSLEPVDKLVWLILRAYADPNGAEFPTMRKIATEANIGARNTVLRSLAILRALRWLSLCSFRSPGGSNQSRIWTLNSPNLPVDDTVFLDPAYGEFLHSATEHAHASVRRIAGYVLATIGDRLKTEGGAEQPSRLQASLQTDLQAASSSLHEGFRLSGRPLRQFAVEGLENQETVPPLQNLNMQNLNMQILKGVSSSSFIYRSNTGTTRDPLQNLKPPAPGSPLVFPARLRGEQRAAAAGLVEALPDALRQAVLDELEGRLRAEKQGAEPVYDELRYLERLCGEVRKGRFIQNLGCQVARERALRTAAAAAETEARRARDVGPDTAKSSRLAGAASPIQAIKDLLK